MDYTFDVIDADSLNVYCISRLNDKIKSKKDEGYHLVSMLPIQNDTKTDRVLLIFWKISAGPCPMKLSSATPKMLDIE